MGSSIYTETGERRPSATIRLGLSMYVKKEDLIWTRGPADSDEARNRSVPDLVIDKIVVPRLHAN